MNHGLIHAAGPNPPNPGDARTLGYEERKLCTMLVSLPGSFRMFCHAASIPELVSLVRARGRDCTYEPFGTSQALLRVCAS